MPSQSERDEVDLYLDKVTAGRDKVPSAEALAKGYAAAFGIAVSAKDAQKLQSIRAEAGEHSITQCIRGTLAETRSEMELHLRLYIARLEMDGIAHDQAVSQTLERFGDPQKLGNKIRREVSVLCRRQSHKSGTSNQAFINPGSFVGQLPFWLYFLIWAYVPGVRTGSLIEADAIGIVPFLFGCAVSMYSASRTPAVRDPMGLVTILRNKHVANATINQRLLGHFLRIFFTKRQPKLLTTGVFLSALVAIVSGLTAASSIEGRCWFGMACDLAGTLFGANVWNCYCKPRNVAN